MGLPQLKLIVAHAEHAHAPDGTGQSWLLHLLPAAFLIVFLCFFGWFIWRSWRVVRLLNEGRGEEFLAAIDKDLARTRTKGYRRVLLINKSAGLPFVGRFAEAVELLDEVDPGKLRGTAKALYANNMLYNLARSDPDRARAFYAEHRPIFEDLPKHRMLRHALRGTHAIYRFLVEGDLGAGEEFRHLAEDERIPTYARAQNLYFLALVAARVGNTTLAKEQYDKAREYSPHCYLGPVPGIATGT